jgi:DNA-directed RNA polymerase specialized sigma subunit
MSKHDPQKTYKDDYNFVQSIINGNAQGWNLFVKKYTDNVWQRAWNLCSEACYNNYSTISCIFHSIKAQSVRPLSDMREGCDDGLEIYSYIFDYLYNRKQGTGKLKFYNGQSSLDTFIKVVLYGNLRNDWIRHKQKIRIDKITHPPEIKKLPKINQKIFDHMVLKHDSKKIAKQLDISVDKVERIKAEISHILMSHGNLYLVIRDIEQPFFEENSKHDPYDHSLDSMQRTIGSFWKIICKCIRDLSDNEKIILDMIYNKELNATAILEQCKNLSISLPVKSRTSSITIHTIYQSIDIILKKVGNTLKEHYSDVLVEFKNYAAPDFNITGTNISVSGLKEFIKNMGIDFGNEIPAKKKS